MRCPTLSNALNVSGPSSGDVHASDKPPRRPRSAVGVRSRTSRARSSWNSIDESRPLYTISLLERQAGDPFDEWMLRLRIGFAVDMEFATETPFQHRVLSCDARMAPQVVP